ncbi:ribosome-binding factor A [Mariprofundus erugo]|uniref:Ribosome-binding factor A n=1 Tax=Mariprofundus erugo TaxID=2528639 RepID=A0A5R9GKN7_9PROT|nr:ribosome-binding factor A [Mariprofundus erugo]TLS66720.1 ribosome-binding factor A [Mariprofundus erugo]TLS78420.1 ribosome-binding factor A [Mariprofundus erugo]
MREISASQSRFLTDIQRLLSTLMLRDVADPRFSGVSITRVEPSGRQAITVWVYRVGECDIEACMTALARMTPHFEHELRRALQKRRLPSLRLRWDDKFEKSGDVLQMLRALERP